MCAKVDHILVPFVGSMSSYVRALEQESDERSRDDHDGPQNQAEDNRPAESGVGGFRKLSRHHQGRSCVIENHGAEKRP